ncbi:Phage-related protein [Halobacillus karajensis]|uniref:phage tail protein n=1 Tax=Halobacillus karajensis TaxID=195088 RepID=UPI0008A80E01|nr:hypothetical protein [Halobacillus karajensis]SEI03701.1 Phage-related protein [Halobacillus karajensis]
MAEYSIGAELKANASKYKRAIQSAKRVTEKFKRESESIKDARLGADTTPLKRNLKKARQMMNLFSRKKSKAEINVGVDDSEAKRKMGLLQAVKTALNKKVVIPVEARINKFQKTMGRIANSIQAFDTVASNTFRGLGIMVSSSLVPIIASLVPVIMAVGNAIGVVGSGAVAMAAAFGIAGGAAIAYGATAAPTIKSIIDGTAESTKENIKAAKQLNSLKDAWSKVQEVIAPQVAVAFGNAMKGLETVIESLNPMFTNIADTVAKLSERFNTFFESSSAQSFFDYLNGSAAPILEKIVNGVTGFIEGLMNLTVAFAPLTDFMAQGFEDMGGSFAEFTEKVAGSQELQSFIQYVKENLPKIKQIFGDVFRGIINLFTAFSDNSSTIFDSLSTMAAKFREWSSTIAESDGFQKFIQYVQENGPKVVALIGNVIKFIINLGIALAPMGAKILDIANKFISWTNSMMESHPIIGKIIAIATVLAGAFIALIPNILAVISAFPGLGGAIMKVLPIIARIGGTLMRFAGGPIGLVIQAVILLAMIIYNNWDSIKVWTLQAWGAVKDFLLKTWRQIKAFVIKYASLLYVKARYYFNLAKTAIELAMSTAWSIIQGIWRSIKSFFTETLAGIVRTAKRKFSEFVSGVRQKMNDAWNKVEEIWGKVQGFFEGIDLMSIGQNIIQGLIDGIGSMFGSIKNMVSKAANLVPDWLKKKLGIASPSKVTTQLGEFTGEGMVVGVGKMLPRLAKKAKEMAGAITPKEKDMTINPALQMKSSKISSSLRSLKRKSMGQVESAVHADVRFSNRQPANINLHLGSRNYRGFVNDISDQQELEVDLEDEFA